MTKKILSNENKRFFASALNYELEEGNLSQEEADEIKADLVDQYGEIDFSYNGDEYKRYIENQKANLASAGKGALSGILLTGTLVLLHFKFPELESLVDLLGLGAITIFFYSFLGIDIKDIDARDADSINKMVWLGSITVGSMVVLMLTGLLSLIG